MHLVPIYASSYTNFQSNLCYIGWDIALRSWAPKKYYIIHMGTCEWKQTVITSCYIQFHTCYTTLAININPWVHQWHHPNLLSNCATHEHSRTAAHCCVAWHCDAATHHAAMTASPPPPVMLQYAEACLGMACCHPLYHHCHHIVAQDAMAALLLVLPSVGKFGLVQTQFETVCMATPARTGLYHKLTPANRMASATAPASTASQ